MAERLLVQTRGNLYALNLVSRLGELSGNEQVRVLDNTVRMSDLGACGSGRTGHWIDPLGLGRNQHAAAAPLSGAFWDCLVELYQDRLVARGAIGPRLDTRGWTRAEVEDALEPLQRATGAALERFEDDFFAALQAARDLTGLRSRVASSDLTRRLGFRDRGRALLRGACRTRADAQPARLR